MAAVAATPSIAERERSAFSSEVGSLFAFVHSACRWFSPILFIQVFKIQIQTQNLRVISASYGAKSENMGGIGERLGGVE